MRCHARVSLGRVEVLVAEQLLHLAEVRAGAEKLRGEDVAERVWRHALALADARRSDVVAEDLPELRVVERLALDATKSACSINGTRVA